MESRVDIMFVGIFSILVLGLLLLLLTLLLVAIFSKGTTRVIAGGLWIGILLMILIGAAGMFSVRTEIRHPQARPVLLPTISHDTQLQTAPPELVSPMERPVSPVSTSVPRLEANRDAYRDISNAAQRDVVETSERAQKLDTENPGRIVGEWAGSLYQGFRNKLNSGDLSLDASSIIPPGRPAWVEQEGSWGPGEIYTVAVSSGPYDRQADCRAALDDHIHQAIGQFANEFLGHSQAEELLAAELASLKEDAVEETYQEELTPSIGIMHQWHALLKFDGTVQQKLRELWETQQRLSRVIYLGGGFVGLLALLTIFYFCLALSGEGSRVSSWLVSAGTVAALGALFMGAVIFVRTFPML